MSIIKQKLGAKPDFVSVSAPRATAQNKVAKLSSGRAVAAGYHPALTPGKMHGLNGSAKSLPAGKSGTGAIPANSVNNPLYATGYTVKKSILPTPRG